MVKALEYLELMIDNPLFLAKDVADWIEHSDITRMMDLVEDDEKLKRIIYESGQNREMWFLNEDGLYEVLMQSRKPIAKRMKKEIKKVLKTIRSTGAYINNTDLMVNTYFGALPNDQKLMIKSLFTNIEKQQKEIEHKENVIIGLVDEISLAEKRQIINRVVKKGTKKYSERWNALYREFEDKYHLNLKIRLESYNNHNKPKIKNKLDFIDKVLNKVPELYEIACKLYENDVKLLVNEMYELNNVVVKNK